LGGIIDSIAKNRSNTLTHNRIARQRSTQAFETLFDVGAVEARAEVDANNL
jgi:hypothetical protein